MKKSMQKFIIGLLVFGCAVLLIFFMGKNVYFKEMLAEEGLDKSEEKSYKYQFVMIVDEPESAFWQAVYKSARICAEECDVLLEMNGSNWDNQYEKKDYMNMNIAAQVDGIILEYNGEMGMEEKINEAVEAGIPVVTVMGDATASGRQSFVGINDYQMGAAYGEEVAKYVNEDTKSITILKKMNPGDMKQSQLFTQISNAALAQTAEGQKLKIDGKTLVSTGAFDAEETIRNIFQQVGGPPDILVCMDEETTECALQAMIDYNMAGKVQIIGYYTSEVVKDALLKGLIPSTCDIDTDSLGKDSVEALLEYLEEGRVNVYYSVDLKFVTAESLTEMERSQEKIEKIQVEKSFAGQ